MYQSLALYALLDPDIHLVNLSGAAGSGKTILALAAAIEQTMVSKRYRRIIATRSVQGLDEDIGFLPGTEAEKMEPWLGAITDNLEALHMDDECTHGSVDYILSKVPLQFKSLNYIRGRSFQQSLILIDECQNLTPHQMKTIITRAGSGSKVICLGNLAQIDTPYLSATSSGLTYLTERFKDFPTACVTLQGCRARCWRSTPRRICNHAASQALRCARPRAGAAAGVHGSAHVLDFGPQFRESAAWLSPHP